MLDNPDYIEARTDGEWRLPTGPAPPPCPSTCAATGSSFGHPIPLFEHLHKTFGPIAHYRFMGTLIVFVNDPAWINEILINQAGSFIKERTLKRMKILLGEGLITSDDPIHMRQRRIAAPAFHRQRIAAMRARSSRAPQPRATAGTPAQTIDIAAAMMELSLRIIARTLFDTEVTPEVLSVADEVNTIMGLYNFLVAFPKLESVLHWPIPGVVKFRRSRARLDAIVGAHDRQPPRSRRGRAGQPRRPALHADRRARRSGRWQHGMTDEQVRDEALTIFLAGYETVANALTWTWYLLSQNPEAAARMAAEVDEVLGERDARRSKTTARLQVHRDGLRRIDAPLPAGVGDGPPVHQAGHSSASTAFRPARTSSSASTSCIAPRNTGTSPTASAPSASPTKPKPARPRFAYFPFGGGRRQCIGEGFAWMEGVLALATIAQRWRLRFVPRYPVEPQAKITLRPKFPHDDAPWRTARQCAVG